MLDGVQLYVGVNKKFDGTLTITSHYIVVSSAASNFYLLHSNIDSVYAVDKGSHRRFVPTREAGVTICIFTKDFAIYEIQLPDISSGTAILSDINEYRNRDNTFPYSDEAPSYLPFCEAPIQDVFNTLLLTGKWRISLANKNFALCDSYAEEVIVPTLVDDEDLMAPARMRSGGRFPIVLYHCAEKGTVLLGASGPKQSSTSDREGKEGDIKYCDALLDGTELGYQMELLPAAETTNVGLPDFAATAGFYSTRWLRERRFFPPLNVLRDTFNQFVESGIAILGDKRDSARVSKDAQSLVNAGSSIIDFIRDDSDKKIFPLQTIATGIVNEADFATIGKRREAAWLSHVRDALSCGSKCAKILCGAVSGSAAPKSVLITESTSTDFCILISSLAQLILSPDSRTIRGFQRLVSREWLLNGHPFQTRCRRGPFDKTPFRGESPVFLLFLDCVYQMFCQYITSFEFNEQLLIALAHNAYSSEYGTFLFDSEKERSENDVAGRTASLWSHIFSETEVIHYTNALYAPAEKPYIWPCIAPQALLIWSDLYRRQMLPNRQRPHESRVIDLVLSKFREIRMENEALRDLMKTALEPTPSAAAPN